MKNVININDYKMKRDMAKFGLSSSDLIEITDRFILSMQKPKFRIFRCGKIFFHDQFWNPIGSNKCYKLC